MTIRESLLVTGYQEQYPGNWIKPVAHIAYGYNETTKKLGCYFFDKNGVICTWKTTDLSDTSSFVNQIQSFELSYSVTGFGPGFFLNKIDLGI